MGRGKGRVMGRPWREALSTARGTLRRMRDLLVADPVDTWQGSSLSTPRQWSGLGQWFPPVRWTTELSSSPVAEHRKCKRSNNRYTHAVEERQSASAPFIHNYYCKKAVGEPVGDSGEERRATLLKLPVCLFSKHKSTQNRNGKHYNWNIISYIQYIRYYNISRNTHRDTIY